MAKVVTEVINEIEYRAVLNEKEISKILTECIARTVGIELEDTDKVSCLLTQEDNGSRGFCVQAQVIIKRALKKEQ